LKNDIEQLKNENEKLKSEIFELEVLPGGKIYQECLKDFNIKRDEREHL